MRTSIRLIAGLSLLGSAACAYAGAVTPFVEPWKEARDQDPLPTAPAADEPRWATDPKFMLRIEDADFASAPQPLYLMDGNPLVGEPYLRPVDIVSVEVVTGEAAALRYGVHPSRTVVLVTTRWGQARGRS
jgi:hypothetical protein